MRKPTWFKYLVLLGILFTSEAEGGSLLNQRRQSRKTPACCEGDKILSCLQVTLDASTLGEEDLYLEPLNATLSFVGTIDGSKNGFHYSNDDMDFTLTFDAQTGSAFGHASLDDGRSFTIEYCRGKVHVLKEIDIQNMQIEYELLETSDDETATSVVRSRNRNNCDSTTIVTYTVKVYYTPEFAARTPNIKGYLDQIIQETNQGYSDSEVPMRVKIHVIEETNLRDIGKSADMLSEFIKMKGSLETLRGTADATFLLVGSFTDGSGGRAMGGIRERTLVLSKSASLGYFFIGQFLAVNMGLKFGSGHHIRKGSATTGFRSLFASKASGYSTRVNHYSNPNVNLKRTGTPTGETGVSNNAKVLTEQRCLMAAVGDESKINCANANANIWQHYQSIGSSTDYYGCRAKCNADQLCASWYQSTTKSGWWSKRKYHCYHVQLLQKPHGGYVNGPNYRLKSCFLDNSSCTNNGNVRGTIKYIDTTKETSADDCHEACKNIPSCTNWLYDIGSHKCTLMYHTYVKYSGYIAGRKNC